MDPPGIRAAEAKNPLGVGAGVGGIVHGKKGALIDSAIGGGVASLFESAHRR